MTAATRNVLKQALSLKPIEKAELINELFNSFDENAGRDNDALWAAESESRIGAFDAGLIEADSAEAVLDRINSK